MELNINLTREIFQLLSVGYRIFFHFFFWKMSNFHLEFQSTYPPDRSTDKFRRHVLSFIVLLSIKMGEFHEFSILRLKRISIPLYHDVASRRNWSIFEGGVVWDEAVRFSRSVNLHPSLILDCATPPTFLSFRSWSRKTFFLLLLFLFLFLLEWWVVGATGVAHLAPSFN